MEWSLYVADPVTDSESDVLYGNSPFNTFSGARSTSVFLHVLFNNHVHCTFNHLHLRFYQIRTCGLMEVFIMKTTHFWEKNLTVYRYVPFSFYSPDSIHVFKSNCSKTFKPLHWLPLFIAREQHLPFFFFWNTFTTDVTLVFDNKQRGGDLG